MDYFILYAALGVLLVTLLAMNVSMTRIRLKIGNGDGNNATLKKAIRAHMNAFEHVLPFAVILFALTQVSIGALWMGFFAIGFILIRALHGYAMLFSKFKLRQVSAGLTYLFELLGCFILLFKLVSV